MAVARFNWGGETLTFGTVGDVAARVFGSRESIHFRIRRGILGGQAPNPVVTHHPWDPANILVLHSDGLTSRWRWTDFPSLSGESATVAAQKLLHALAKDNDDATVVVVKGAEEQRREVAGQETSHNNRGGSHNNRGGSRNNQGDRPQQPGGSATTTGELQRWGEASHVKEWSPATTTGGDQLRKIGTCRLWEADAYGPTFGAARW
jgi:hypothetical protein